uniref:non-specific serine/threonine protein kinase n=1 Tax=Alexandrium monilatum TaxID=311494 RepID=A0A7S4SDQ7_9DINO
MDSLWAGYERLRRRTERVGDKVMKQALNSGSQVRHALNSGRHYSIGGRTVVEERQISEGGFAFVWAVRDSRTHEELALKKIVCQDREGLAMARREVDLLERLPQHRNLVKYYGHTICDTDGRSKEVALLFELCTGGHLLHLLERNKGVLDEERIVHVLTEVCTAVAVLHRQSPPVQHRDLKVENVLLGSDGAFKLCDFGSWNDEATDPSTLGKQEIGVLQEQIERYTTMMYRPPEMVDFFQQFAISEKVDIWMLGCILYTLMFSRHPFQDESTLAIANARYNLPSTPQYSERLQDLVHWLLARDPAHRPGAPQLLDVLQNFGNGGSLPLPRPVVEKLGQFRRLYSDQPSPPISSSGESPAPQRKPPRAKQHHKHSKSRHERRDSTSEGTAAGTGGFWAKADLAQGDAAGVWPSVAVPEPSRAWATFDAFGAFPQDLSERSASQGGAPAAPPSSRGTSPQQRSPASRRGDATCGSPPGPTSETWLGAPAPSVGSRAPPPGDGSHTRAPPLALSGRSSQSGKSATSHGSAVSGHSASLCTDRSSHSEPLGSASGRSPTGGSSRSPRDARPSPDRRASLPLQPPPRQDSGGEFWSLASAEATNQPWDPFARHVQWPGVTGPPSVSPASCAHAQHASEPEAEAAERRSVTPPRHRAAAGRGPHGAGAPRPGASSAPVPASASEPGPGAPAAGEAPADGLAQRPCAGAASPDPWLPSWTPDQTALQQHFVAAAPTLDPSAAHGPQLSPQRASFGPPSAQVAWPNTGQQEVGPDATPPWPPFPAPGAFALQAKHRRTVSAPVPSQLAPREPEKGAGTPLAADVRSISPGVGAQQEPAPRPWGMPHAAQGGPKRPGQGSSAEGADFARPAWPP